MGHCEGSKLLKPVVDFFFLKLHMRVIWSVEATVYVTGLLISGQRRV